MNPGFPQLETSNLQFCLRGLVVWSARGLFRAFELGLSRVGGAG